MSLNFNSLTPFTIQKSYDTVTNVTIQVVRKPQLCSCKVKK